MTVAAWLGAPPVRAEELLENGDFEAIGTWIGVSEPEVDTSIGQSGSSWRLAVPGGEAVTLKQTVSISAETASAAVYLRADIAITGSLKVTPLDAGAVPLQPFQTSADIGAGPTFVQLMRELDLPVNAAYATFAITINSAESGNVWVDTATLSVAGAPVPTPTPLSTSTPTPTKPVATATPTRTPTQPTQPTGNSSTPVTSTPTTTKTKTPTTVPSTARPSSSNGGGAVPNPGSNGPGGAVPSDTSGGLLLNGGFEFIDGTVPAGWLKNGGTMTSSGTGHSGAYGVSYLSQSNSTKWIYQVVPVTAGQWYEFSAWTLREAGDGEAFLRLSFYAAGDGSGSTFAQVDSTTTSSSAAWTMLTTGAVQAPVGAHSVRARLMIRPSGPFSAAFDDASLFVVEEPAATTTLTPPTIAATASPTRTSTPTTAATGTTSTPTPSGRAPGASQPVANFVSSNGTLRINEILYDGDGDPDQAYEWVEIYNAGTEPVSLAGWSIADANSSDELPDTDLAAGGYAVVVPSGFAGTIASAAIQIDDSRIGSGLNNGGDTVTLIDPTGAIFDEVVYGEGEAIANGAGETIGLAPDGHWRATLQPTPGEENVFPVGAEPTPDSVTSSPTVRAGAGTTPTATVDAVSRQPFVDAPVGGTRGTNPLVWVVLGATLGMGGLAAGTAGYQRVRKVREKRRGE